MVNVFCFAAHTGMKTMQGVAAAMTEDMIRQEMQLMKEMGVNFIRLGHYQQSRHCIKPL